LTGGTYTTIDDPSATSTQAFGINDMGQIVGSYGNESGSHGFLYSGGTNGTYTTLDDPSATQGTFAQGINASGQIVGYYKNASGTHGFLYSGGTYTTLDDPLATNGTQAFGINDMGQIVGTYDNASGNHGFLLTITPNPPPPGGTTADMILRASNSSPSRGLYEIYDIGNNSLLAAFQLGQVGTDWQFVGLGAFFGSDTTDMLLRSASRAALKSTTSATISSPTPRSWGRWDWIARSWASAISRAAAKTT